MGGLSSDLLWFQPGWVYQRCCGMLALSWCLAAAGQLRLAECGVGHDVVMGLAVCSSGVPSFESLTRKRDIPLRRVEN